MSSTNEDLLREVQTLRQELQRLQERVIALERANQPDVPEEVIMVIAAAVAAFLGKKPVIRQIRLIGSAAWGAQGRVTIQASHGSLSEAR